MRRSGHFLLIACLALAQASTTTVVMAQDNRSASADEAEVEFRLGNEAYLAGDYGRALSHYFASNRLVPNRNVMFNIAKCYENLSRFVEAYRYYDRYLAGVEDPAERRKVEAALAGIADRVGVLVVESNPPGGTIYLNRRDLGAYGTTPATVPVEPGSYTIVVERSGYAPATLAAIDVAGGDRVSQKVELDRLEARVELIGEPRDLSVTTPDGSQMRVRLPTTVDLPLGTQVLTVEAPGFRTRTMTVDVAEGTNPAVDVSLEREVGQIVVHASEVNSTIFLDGELVGFTPAVVDVSVGPHQVVIRQEGFQPYQQTVDVTPQQRTEVDAVLQSANEIAAASRRAESLGDAPASVSLVSNREIQAFGYTGTRDALTGTRGMFFTNDLTYLQPGVRGYGPFGQFGNRLLVLIDGHAMNDSWLEASFHEFEILSDIYGLDRIELVRGPTSVLYGSGAFQGVINLASPPIDDEFQKSRVGVGGSGEGVVRTYAHVREAVGPVGVQLSGGVVRGQPRDYLSSSLGAAANVGDFWAGTARANASWGDFSLLSFVHKRDKQSPTGAYDTLFGDRRAREADTRAFVDLRWERDLVEAASLELRSALDYYAFDGVFPYPEDEAGLFTDTFEGIWASGEGRLVLRPFGGARWTAAFEGARHLRHDASSFVEDGTVTLDQETPFTKLAASLMARQKITDAFSVWAGARYDLWLFDALPAPDGGDAAKTVSNINPRLVFFLRPIETGTIKLIGSRGFRAPSVYELTYNDGGVTQVSSPGLEPETIWSTELEYSQKIGEHWEAIGAAYLQRVANRIEVSGAATDTDPLQFVNVDDSLWSGGLEAELRREFFRGWMAAAQYGFQRTRDGDVAALFEPGDNVPNSPRHLGSLKIVSPIVPHALALANRVVVESSRIDREGNVTRPAVLWDLMLTGTATPHQIRYSFGLRNLLDWSYDHPVGDEVRDPSLPQTGRTFVVDLAAQF